MTRLTIKKKKAKPLFRIVQTLMVTRRCGHETDHDVKTKKRDLKQLIESQCFDCRSSR